MRLPLAQLAEWCVWRNRVICPQKFPQLLIRLNSRHRQTFTLSYLRVGVDPRDWIKFQFDFYLFFLVRTASSLVFGVTIGRQNCLYQIRFCVHREASLWDHTQILTLAWLSHPHPTLLYSGKPWTHHMTQLGWLQTPDPPASTYGVLDSPVCAITHSKCPLFIPGPTPVTFSGWNATVFTFVLNTEFFLSHCFNQEVKSHCTYIVLY